MESELKMAAFDGVCRPNTYKVPNVNTCTADIESVFEFFPASRPYVLSTRPAALSIIDLALSIIATPAKTFVHCFIRELIDSYTQSHLAMPWPALDNTATAWDESTIRQWPTR